MTWDINADWKYDAALGTEVEVLFHAETPTRTRVELEHRKLDRFGTRRDEMKGVLGSEGGWPILLDRYSKRF